MYDTGEEYFWQFSKKGLNVSYINIEHTSLNTFFISKTETKYIFPFPVSMRTKEKIGHNKKITFFLRR